MSASAHKKLLRSPRYQGNSLSQAELQKRNEALEKTHRAALAQVEGLVQAVDASGGRLRLVNRDFSVPDSAVIKDTMKTEIGLDGLKEGDVVKVKGAYEPGSPFLASKVKMKESMGFNIEEMQGCIDSIDIDSRRFEMIGVTILVTEKTSIEL